MAGGYSRTVVVRIAIYRAHMAIGIQVVFDAADPGKLAAFWAEALDYVVQPPPPGFDSWEDFADKMGFGPEDYNSRSAIIDPSGSGARVFFQRVPEGKAAKNRVHLDVRAAPGLQGEARMAALEAEAERLVAHGATRLERHDPTPPLGAGHIVMTDPESNEFCLD